MKDYYYLLGLKPSASVDDIKNSYRRLSKKFHPDVNDGDAFFAERFKDIQEAYEVLTNLERRKLYDFKYSNKTESSSNKSNFSPEIEFFTSNKIGMHIGDDITFKWKTINADVVVLEPLGPVKPIGEITYKISNVKIDKIRFKLVAVNSHINRKTESEIIVNNLTYDEIYKFNKDNLVVKKRMPFWKLWIRCYLWLFAIGIVAGFLSRGGLGVVVAIVGSIFLTPIKAFIAACIIRLSQRMFVWWGWWGNF